MGHECFELASELNVNCKKSKILLDWWSGRFGHFGISLFGCKARTPPPSLLGCLWEHVLSLVWCGIQLRRGSKGGWTLGRNSICQREKDKRTLTSLPIYFMSLFVMPKKVTSRLEKYQRLFLWKSHSDEIEVHLLNWRTVYDTKRNGGLGIRNLDVLNDPLLGKWLWRYALECNYLGRKIIQGKYGEVEGGWSILEGRKAFGMALWKAIRKGWEEFSLRTSFLVKNSLGTKFWSR